MTPEQFQDQAAIQFEAEAEPPEEIGDRLESPSPPLRPSLLLTTAK